MLSYIAVTNANVDLADALRKARRAMGISQRELGQRSGLTQAQISRIENGMVDMRVSSLLAMAEVLKLQLSMKRLSPRVGAAGPGAVTRSRPGRTATGGQPASGLGVVPRPGIFGDIDEELL